MAEENRPIVDAQHAHAEIAAQVNPDFRLVGGGDGNTNRTGSVLIKDSTFTNSPVHTDTGNRTVCTML